MLPCSWKEAFDITCPSCGAQRSLSALVHGDVAGSIYLFPALLPLVFTVLIVAVHLVRPLKNGPRMIVCSFAFSALVMMGSWAWHFFAG